mmetsp:Transcript_28656/g.93046  ORF Transcript_28656/g.93046 Transcript_28656/m.93046 type:complete len:272 (-) Transcript_28656:636-1451(-)
MPRAVRFRRAAVAHPCSPSRRHAGPCMWPAWAHRWWTCGGRGVWRRCGGGRVAGRRGAWPCVGRWQRGVCLPICSATVAIADWYCVWWSALHGGDRASDGCGVLCLWDVAAGRTRRTDQRVVPTVVRDAAGAPHAAIVATTIERSCSKTAGGSCDVHVVLCRWREAGGGHVAWAGGAGAACATYRVGGVHDGVADPVRGDGGEEGWPCGGRCQVLRVHGDLDCVRGNVAGEVHVCLGAPQEEGAQVRAIIGLRACVECCFAIGFSVMPPVL